MNLAFPAAVASLALCGIAGNRIGNHFGSAKLGTFIGLAAGVFVANMVGETLSSREEKIGAPVINESAAEEKIALEKSGAVKSMADKAIETIATITEITPEATQPTPIAVRRRPSSVTNRGASSDGGNAGFYGLVGPLATRVEGEPSSMTGFLLGDGIRAQRQRRNPNG